MTSKSEVKTSFNNTELWKARQLKEYRRLNNLCFNCGDKYTPTHTYSTPTTNLHMIQPATVYGSQFLSDDLLDAMDNLQLFSMKDDDYLSLYALSGQPQQRSIQLRALVQNQALVILVDSGSSHTFLNSKIAHKLKVDFSPISPLSVKVVNGALLPCTSEVKGFQWWIHGNTFQMDAKVLDMGAYDLVLGMNWLKQFRPMVCDWLDKWIKFQYQDTIVRL
jgi:hypothetical protein